MADTTPLKMAESSLRGAMKQLSRHKSIDILYESNKRELYQTQQKVEEQKLVEESYSED